MCDSFGRNLQHAHEVNFKYSHGVAFVRRALLSTIFKDLLFLNCLAIQSQISFGACKENGMKVYENGPSYMPCPFMVKTFKNVSRTKSLMIILKLGIHGAFWARGLQSLCINTDIDGNQTQSQLIGKACNDQLIKVLKK